MVLPEVDESPVEPEFEAFVRFLCFGCYWTCLHAVCIESIGLDSTKARIFSQSSHARDKLIRSYPRVENWVESGSNLSARPAWDGDASPGDLTRLAVELVADTKQERTQALDKGIDPGGLCDRLY